MRHVTLSALVALAIGCGHGSPAAPAPAPGSAATTPPPPAPLPAGHARCGTTSCPVAEYCVESTLMGGMPPPPGEPADITTAYRCSATPPAEPGCAPPVGQFVHCESAAP